jgi:hypothetical protein
MGYIYRLSEKNYRLMLARAAADQPLDLDGLARSIGHIERDVTDITVDEAQDALESIKALGR